jgi:hypothetical protein
MALASGYALCRCAISPAAPPADLDVFHSCAEDESGEFFRSIHSDEALMCVSGHLSLLPFEDYLKCLYDGMRERGLYWLERCRAPETPYDDFTENTPSLSCEMDELVTLVLLECSMR